MSAESELRLIGKEYGAMPMGSEVTGRMVHAADRRWRSPDVESVSLENAADVSVNERKRRDDDATELGYALETAADRGLASSRAWESALEGTLRLSPAEQANPAFSHADSGEHPGAASGAYGGRGPRYDEGQAVRDRIAAPITSGEGRWVRTGGCGVRWLSDGADPDARDDEQYWRWVSSSVEQAEAQSGEIGPTPVCFGPFAYLENGDGTVTIVSYKGDVRDVEIPSEVDGAVVSVLGASLFANHSEIESVTLPHKLKTIDDHAFDGCTSLSHIDLPSSLECIGMLAFAKTGVESIHIPPAVVSIGDKAFFHCKRLVAVELLPGLRVIGECAFSYSGVARVVVPASVEVLGFNAFDLTPAQKHASEGMIQIDPHNPRYRFDRAGLYCDDALVELIGYVDEYEVDPRTRSIAAGACKRHPTISRMHLPEGLIEIGEDAFRSNRRLRSVNLPESLERIGARAFVDTSIAYLRIGRNLVSIGEDALLVQGEAQMNSKTPLARVDVDECNAVYYIQNGLLCERDSSPGGGDTCLLYVGPDAVVRIPEQVTNVAVMAFGGAVGIDELYVHGHMHSFCYGWLSMKESIRCIHVEFGDPVDGYARGDFPLPELTTRFRYMTDLFSSTEGKTVFDFDYLDSWVTCSGNVNDMAEAAYARMREPMGMSAHALSVYQGVFERKGKRFCRYFAERSQIDALEFLIEGGWIDLEDINAELDIALRDGRTQATACLLEMKHRLEPTCAKGVDFSL